MKSLLLSIVFAISLSANAIAQVENKEVLTTPRLEKQYKKVETSQIPASILKQASVRYSGYALNEAFVSEELEYKLVLTKNNKAVNAYYKNTGEFIKEEAKS